MNNDYYNQYRKERDKSDSVKEQQMGPGRFPGFPFTPPSGGPSRPPFGPPSGPPSGPPFGPPSGPPSGQPRMEAPRSAPPNFTPELPRMEGQQPFSGPSDSRIQFGDGRADWWRRRPRNFRGCIGQFTFVWLINGNSFWFYPIFVGRNAVEGFRWRRGRWDYDRINLNRVLFFRCF